MNSNSLQKLSSGALMAGAVCISLFWILVIPFETFAGVDTVLDPLQLLAQVFHTLGAILLIFGFFGFYAAYNEEVKLLGFFGFVLTALGMIGLAVDAIIGLVVAPALAEEAPATIESNGALFTGNILLLYIMIFMILMIGQLILGFSLRNVSEIPKVTLVLFVLGAILSNLPPLPVLHYVLVIGGVIGGIGTFLLGYALYQGSK